MGCASSTPLVESGKNLVEAAKETANDAVAKGEQVFNDVGESAKDGMETVKDTMSSAFTTAENSVGHVVGKIGETFNFASSQAKEGIDHVEASKDEMMNNASDATAEAISEAETVLASEAENVKEIISESTATLHESVNSMSNDISEKVHDIHDEAIEMKNKAVESLHIEDIDQSFDMLGDSVAKVEKKAEEVLKSTPNASPTKEIQKEECPPTFWEAAADAIILRKTLKTMDFQEPDSDRIFPKPENACGNEEKEKPRDLSVKNDLIISDLENK